MQAVWRGSVMQRARLWSGLVLFAFATTHFFNHALGLVSLEAMVWFEGWRIVATRSTIGSAVLLVALLVHVVLALAKLMRRRTLTMPRWERWQTATGLIIPVFLLPHIVNTRIAQLLFGVDTTYPYELARIWPATIVTQSVLLLLVWVHGCIGIHFWLRLHAGYRRFVPILFAFAVLLPFAALTGVSVQGRAVGAALADPQSLAAFKAATHWPEGHAAEAITGLRDRAQMLFGVCLGGLLLAAGLRILVQRRARRIRIQYVAGPEVRTERGPTLLEISRGNKIPHMAVCGGRGRCSTCRVLVLGAASGLEPPTAVERETLRSIDAGPNVRLACQARPKADVTVMRLLQVNTAHEPIPAAARNLADRDHAGVERDLAVLFVDMRGFTAITERRLAFDVVFILNQFFATVGQPVYDMGGWVANYAGDGMIALFADEAGLESACRSALLAAAQIDRALTTLNQTLAAEVQQPLRIAMGLHAGPLVIGRVGYKASQSLSVIGLAINVASRMEALAKSAGVQMVFSEIVARHAGLDTGGLRVEEQSVRGMEQPIGVVFIDQARDIALRLREMAIETA